MTKALCVLVFIAAILLFSDVVPFTLPEQTDKKYGMIWQ